MVVWVVVMDAEAKSDDHCQRDEEGRCDALWQFRNKQPNDGDSSAYSR